MKKLLLLLVGATSLVASAQAQYARQNMMTGTAGMQKTVMPVATATKHTAAKNGYAAKTTAATFYTQDFAGGIPSGWSTGALTGGDGLWHHTTVASTSSFSMGAMNSTSAANGWMIFDSDSIGAALGGTPRGYLQTAAISCTGHSTVRLNFQNYFRRFNDSCSVWVSTTSSFMPGTYTDFPVFANNALPTNSSSANPSTIHMNISSVAGGAANVYIRFVTYSAAGGSYSWMIDDMSLSELDPHDVSVSKSFFFEPDPTAYDGSIFTTPLAFVDTVFPVTQLTNYGYNAETNVNVSANIYNGSTSVYSQNIVYPNLVVDAMDTLIQGFAAGYKPTTTGNYTAVFTTSITATDDVPANNTDTVKFAVSDSTWQQNAIGAPLSSYAIRRVTGGGAGPSSNMIGSRFDVSTNVAGDTVSGFAVSFNSASLPTGSGTVAVQLYSIQQASSGWTYLGTSVSKSIPASEISTTMTPTYTYFRADPVASGGVEPFILHPGTSYAAVIQINGVNTNLFVNATTASAATGFSGFFGQGDTSMNDGAAEFSPTSIATGNASIVPMIRMFFGNAPTLAVNDVNLNGSYIGRAFPNPANTSVAIPFTAAENGVVTVTISNVVGQVVKTQQINAVAGQATKATFSTSDLTSGVYLYTVTVNGRQTTGRVSVTH